MAGILRSQTKSRGVRQATTSPGCLPADPRFRQISGATEEKRSEVAGYIAQMTAELCDMATEVNLASLAYFLSMARLEAELAARAPLQRETA